MPDALLGPNNKNLLAVFELPAAVLGLVRVRGLSSARLRRNRRIGYFASPSPSSCCSIRLAVFFERRWQREPEVVVA